MNLAKTAKDVRFFLAEEKVNQDFVRWALVTKIESNFSKYLGKRKKILWFYNDFVSDILNHFCYSVLDFLELSGESIFSYESKLKLKLFLSTLYFV